MNNHRHALAHPLLGRRASDLLDRLGAHVTAHPTYLVQRLNYSSNPRVEISTTRVLFLAPCPTCGETFASRLRITERNELRSPFPDSTEHAWAGECRCCREATLNRQRVARHRARHRQARQPITCEQCGTSFTSHRSTARFCSARCRVAAYRRA